MHELDILYSHVEWNLLSSLCDDSKKNVGAELSAAMCGGRPRVSNNRYKVQALARPVRNGNCAVTVSVLFDVRWCD